MDAWLLRNFPGRTLDELDRMDWGRYLRAVEAGHVERVEQRRADQMAGRVKSEDISPDEWDAIRAHDGLMAEYAATASP